MKHLRIATKEEVESIRDISNLPQRYTVFAMEQNASSPDLAVVKEVVELDPVIFGARTNDFQKAKFVFALEERMAGAGIQQYRYAVRYDDATWKKVIENWGGRLLNEYPESRYEKEI